MFGGVAGYRPRVRSAYYERVYVHSPERQVNYNLILENIKGLLRRWLCLWWRGGCLGLTQTFIYGAFWLGNCTDALLSELKVVSCTLAMPNLAVWSHKCAVVA